MAKRVYGHTYFREWRQKKGFSLRETVRRMEVEPGGKSLISYASLGRIEQRKQPYNQPILEALSQALGVPKAALLEMNPNKEGEVIDLVRVLNKAKQTQAIEYLRFLATK
jgi:transcriptional regulator with XRE-family HTH domain